MNGALPRHRALEAMLRLSDISLTYNRGSFVAVNALDGVSLDFHRGEFVTIVGSNGAGKSSLANVVSGSVRPTSGNIWLNDRDITRVPDYRRARWVARVFDNPLVGTAPDLSIEENLALAIARGRRRGLRFAVSDSRRRTMREHLEVLDLGLENRLSQRVALLSAGQRQSLTMIMAAMGRPEVLLLDEHLAALDPETQRRVLEVTERIAGEMSCTTLMITHNMAHAIAVGTRLLVMSRGRVVADITGHEKSALSPDEVVDKIVGAGDTVSDRVALAELE